MAINNRDRVGRGLEILASGLGAFVDSRMKAAVPDGGDWLGVLAARDKSRYGTARQYSLSDPRFLLRVLTEEWRAFKGRLSRAEQSFAAELRDTGNRWAHGQAFSADDTYRALDTMERLLAAVGAPGQAADARRLRLDLQPATTQPPAQFAGGDATAVQAGGGLAAGDRANWRLILDAARALTAAGQTPFTRIRVYQWIWRRYPRDDHDRPSLDPTFQGMVRNATGGPPSAGGTPLLRVDRGRYILAED
jgi:Swt1-like HEPN